jgi:hypothetical protein
MNGQPKQKAAGNTATPTKPTAYRVVELPDGRAYLVEFHQQLIG